MVFLLIVYLHFISPRSGAIQVKLFSYITDQFVQINEDGSITADGSEESAAVFNALIQGRYISLELINEPGNFLMLNETFDDRTNAIYSTVSHYLSPSRYELHGRRDTI